MTAATVAAGFASAVDVLLLGNCGLLSIFSVDWSSPATGRTRDIFPLPEIQTWPSTVEFISDMRPADLKVANLCIVGLNAMWADFKTHRLTAPWRSNPTICQLEAQRHVAVKTARMLTRLQAVAGDKWAWRGAFQHFESASSSQYEPLRGDAVDLPLQAATCDPLQHIPRDLVCAISDSSAIFPEPLPLVQPLVPANEHDYRQYLILVAREMACAKLRLRRHVRGLASVFAAAKATEGRQRKIWNGAQLSAMAARPPPPHRLANPSSLLDIHAETGKPLYYSKRDAETFFDTLKLPSDLQDVFAQPPLLVGDLLRETGMNIAALSELTDDAAGVQLTDNEFVFPVHVVWPMGFSWSSAIAQGTTLACVAAAGVREECVLSVSHKPPSDQSELCLVATDDTVFIHQSHAEGTSTLQRFDGALAAAGIPRKESKDISLVEQVTILGCDVSSRPHMAEPSQVKLLKCLACCLDLLRTKWASPGAVNGLLGLLQWFSLLQRPMFGVFDQIYEFVQREPASDSLFRAMCCVR